MALLGAAARLTVAPIDGAAAGRDHARDGPRHRQVFGPVAALARHDDPRRFATVCAPSPESVVWDSERSCVGIKTLATANAPPRSGRPTRRRRDLEAARIGTRCVHVESGHGMLDHSESCQASRAKERAPMPALPPYIIEPIFEQFTALLPEREVDHPLGCHRSRIPDRVIFEKLVQVLVFGCAYERIADGSCSATTLRDRRDEWIACGAIETLRQIALEAYDSFIGLELTDVAVDGGASPRHLAAARRRAGAR